MTVYDIMNVLGRAYYHGEVEALAPYISTSCFCTSDYSDTTVTSAQEAADWLKIQCDNYDEGGDLVFEVELLKNMAQDEEAMETYFPHGTGHIGPHCLMLYEKDWYEELAAIVVVALRYDKETDLKITGIGVSNEDILFDAEFRVQ